MPHLNGEAFSSTPLSLLQPPPPAHITRRGNLAQRNKPQGRFCCCNSHPTVNSRRQEEEQKEKIQALS
eukprot:scaffold34631_cov251-Amphora_coffeaeformis.AAC.1